MPCGVILHSNKVTLNTPLSPGLKGRNALYFACHCWCCPGLAATCQTVSCGLSCDIALSRWNMSRTSSLNFSAVGSSSWQSNESSTRWKLAKLHWPNSSPHGPPKEYTPAALQCNMGPSPENDCANASRGGRKHQHIKATAPVGRLLAAQNLPVPV